MSSTPSSDRRPISLRQLCAVIRLVRERSPELDAPSQREDLKVELIRQGYDYPEPIALLHQAWTQVDRVMVSVQAPRTLARSRGPDLTHADPPWREKANRPDGTFTSTSALIRASFGSAFDSSSRKDTGYESETITTQNSQLRTHSA